MSAIGEPRGSLVPAETLDAIALLHALGVGSAKRGGQKRGVNEEIMRGSSRKLAWRTEHRECRQVTEEEKKLERWLSRLFSSKL